MATTLLDATLFPQTFLSAAWLHLLSTFNDGKYRWTSTFTNASSNAEWGSGNYHALLASDDNGGWYVYDDGGTRYVACFDNVTGALLFRTAITWGAGAAITWLPDFVGDTFTVSGATTGNGSFALTTTNDPFSDGTLGFGAWGGGGYTWTGSQSDIDDANDAVTLAAEVGTFATTGSAATLRRIVRLTAEAGGVTLTGSAATLRAQLRAIAEAGALALTGADVALRTIRRLAADAGAIALAGTDVDLVGPGGSSSLAAEAGAFSLTGGAVGMLLRHRLGADGGTLALSGTDATLRRVLALVAESAGLALTGSAAGVRVVRRLAAEAGAYALAGGDVDMSGDLSIDDYGVDFQLYGHASRDALVTLDTPASGSLYLVAAGGKSSDLNGGFYDSNALTWNAIDSTRDFTDWPGYGSAIAWARGTGGAGHQFRVPVTLFDESTMFAISVRAGRVRDHSFSQHANSGASSTQTAGAVTIRVRSRVVAFWFGAAPVGQDHVVSFDNGMTSLAWYLTNNNDGYIQALMASGVFEPNADGTPRTLTLTASHSPTQGAQLRVVVLQASDALAADAGAFAVTGSNATLRRQFRLVAEGASVALTGADATLRQTVALTAEAGAFAVTGGAAALVTVRRLSAEGASVALDGSAAALELQRRLVAEAGAVALTGNAAALRSVRRLAADLGALAATGADVALRARRRLAADAGAVALAGLDAVLQRAIHLAADAGAISLTGADVGLRAARRIVAAAGVLALTGSEATLTAGGTRVPLPATLVCTWTTPTLTVTWST